MNKVYKPEPGQLYAIDIVLMNNKNELRQSDIKPVNIVELLSSKTSNSYISLENAGNCFFFISTKLEGGKAKKMMLSTSQIYNPTRSSVIAPQGIIRIPVDKEDKIMIQKINLEPSPKIKARLDSTGPASRTYSPFVSNDPKVSTVSRQESDKKAHISKASRFTEYNSDIVNIYRKPLYGKLKRND